MNTVRNLFARAETPPVAAVRPAIIDLGSNWVRLVVYEGPARLPLPAQGTRAK